MLIARQVRNDGSLTARNGTAAMASGSEVVLSDGSLGNGKVLVRRPAQDGEIRNSGAIRAAEVELRANGGNIYALAGNTGRAITATGVASKGGRIFLTAEGGSVNVTQKVVARRIQADAAPAPTRAGIAGRRSFTGGDVVVSGDKVVVGGAIEAKGNGGAGGTVVVTGTDVTLTSGAAIDASGTSGGTVLIGGDRAGGIGRRAEVSAADHRQCAEHDDRGGRNDHGRRHIGRRRQCGGVVGWHDVVCRRHQHAGCCAAASSRPRGISSTSRAAASMPGPAVAGCSIPWI